jgi:hypothetical protein
MVLKNKTVIKFQVLTPPPLEHYRFQTKERQIIDDHRLCLKMHAQLKRDFERGRRWPWTRSRSERSNNIDMNPIRERCLSEHL